MLYSGTQSVQCHSDHIDIQYYLQYLSANFAFYLSLYNMISAVLCLVETVSISFSKNFNQMKLPFCLADKLVSALRHDTRLT